MLSVKQLASRTRAHRPIIVENAKNVKTRFKTRKTDVDADGDEFTLVKAVCQGDTVTRWVELHFYGSGVDAKVWASCTCEYWLYHCEVAVNRKDSTEILYSNGNKPVITNPRQVPHVCKHILACFLSGAQDLKPRGGSRRRR